MSAAATTDRPGAFGDGPVAGNALADVVAVGAKLSDGDPQSRVFVLCGRDSATSRQTSAGRIRPYAPHGGP